MKYINLYTRTLIFLLLGITLTGCDDNELGEIQRETLYNLTSVTWFNEDYGRYPNGREYYSCQYWDFYDDGTGVWDTYLEVEGYVPEETRTYFVWDFTTENFAVIALDIDGSGMEYWMIDHLSPGRFSNSVFNMDPVYYPSAPLYRQTFYALAE